MEETAIVRINAELDQTVIALKVEVEKSVAYAHSFVVANRGDVEQATHDLTLISMLKKQIEERRKEYTEPLNGHVKAINASFKLFSEPLEQADKTLRGKVGAFNQKARELQAKAEEARRLQEEITRETGELLDPVPVVPAPVTKVYTDVGTLGTRQEWHWEVEDLKLVPFEYLLVNASMVGKLVRAGLHTIPGLRIWAEESLTISARKEPE